MTSSGRCEEVRSAMDWAQVKALAADGVSQTQIATRLGINRRTVKRLLEADEPPRYSPGAIRVDARRVRAGDEQVDGRLAGHQGVRQPRCCVEARSAARCACLPAPSPRRWSAEAGARGQRGRGPCEDGVDDLAVVDALQVVDVMPRFACPSWRWTTVSGTPS